MFDHRLDGIEKGDHIFAVIKRTRTKSLSIDVLRVLRKVEPLQDKRYIEVDQPVLVEHYGEQTTAYRLLDRDINCTHHTAIGDIIYLTSHKDAVRQTELWLNNHKNNRGE